MLLIVACSVSPALAVILGNGSNGNTTALSLQTAGGPLVAEPGFNNVGKSGTGNASVTYLGNGWGITAGHNTMDANFDGVTLNGQTYTVDLNSITFLHNPNSTLADLKLFKLTTTPALPSVLPGLISSVTPTGVVVMIGNGLNITGTQKFWDVDKSNPGNWVWNSEPSQPASPGPDDYSGFSTVTSHSIRWGSNVVFATNVSALTAYDPQNNPLYINGVATQFDNQAYTGINPMIDEAQASTGDSGGGVFSYVNGEWKLSGIMIATSVALNHQPSQTTIYGSQTVIADLSIYRDEILSIVPEPGSHLLALSAAAMLFAGWRLKRRTR